MRELARRFAEKIKDCLDPGGEVTQLSNYYPAFRIDTAPLPSPNRVPQLPGSGYLGAIDRFELRVVRQPPLQ